MLSSLFVEKLALDRPRYPAEFGDHSTGLIGDFHVVDARAASERKLGRLGPEAVAQPARGEIGNDVVLRHGGLVAAVASIGKGGVGKREGDATVADGVAVGVVRFDRHLEHGAPFTVFVTTGFADRTARMWWVEMEEAIAALPAVRIEAAGRLFDLPATTPEEKQAAFEALYWPLVYQRWLVPSN